MLVGRRGNSLLQLHIVREDTTAPALDSTVARFWAKGGEGREIRIGYKPPADTGEDFLRFEVWGRLGTIRFNLERMNELEVFLTKDFDNTSGFRTLMGITRARAGGAARR